MAPRRVDKDEKKRRIGRAAMQVFAAKGYFTTTMDDVAAEAGVAKGTVYLYFKTKNDLLVWTINDYFDVMYAAVEGLLRHHNTPGERLTALIRESFAAFEEQYERSRFMLDIFSHALRSGPDLFDMQEPYGIYIDAVKEILDDGVLAGDFRSMDTAATALFIVAAMDGIFLQWIFSRGSLHLKQLGDTFMITLLQGISRTDLSSEKV